MKHSARPLLLVGLLVSWCGLSDAALAAAVIKTQAPCTAGGGLWCVTFDSFSSTIPVIRSFSFNAPSKGTAAVTFHGSILCGSIFDYSHPDVIDLVSQIVTTSDATPSASGPGGLRLAVVVPPVWSTLSGSIDSFNLASTRVFTIAAAGAKTYYFKIAKLRMDGESYCVVSNGAFTVVFVP
jgi:hypothetical protein